MKRVIVRYKVKEGRGEENAEFVQAVFAELMESQPSGLSYATFQAEDGVSFTHIASFETDHSACRPLRDIIDEHTRHFCEVKVLGNDRIDIHHIQFKGI